jgi:hypothetical protein
LVSLIHLHEYFLVLALRGRLDPLQDLGLAPPHDLLLLAALSRLPREQGGLFKVLLIADEGLLDGNARLLGLRLLLSSFFAQLLGEYEGEGDSRSNQNYVTVLLIKLMNFFKFALHV